MHQTPNQATIDAVMRARAVAGLEVAPEYEARYAAEAAIHEYRYSASQPRDAQGRWSRADSARAAKETTAEVQKRSGGRMGGRAKPKKAGEPETEPVAVDPRETQHTGAAASLRGHARLVAAFVAHALGNKAAAAHHLARAEMHFKNATGADAPSARTMKDMASLKSVVGSQVRNHAAEVLNTPRMYAYDASQKRASDGKWTSGGAGAADHAEGAAYHEGQRAEAKAEKNTPAAGRHHAAQLLHTLAAAHLNGEDTTEHLKNASRAMDTLNVQAREAVERGKGAAEIADKKAAYDHFNTSFKGIKSAMKKGEPMPAMTHFGAVPSGAPAGLATPANEAQSGVMKPASSTVLPAAPVTPAPTGSSFGDKKMTSFLKANAAQQSVSALHNKLQAAQDMDNPQHPAIMQASHAATGPLGAAVYATAMGDHEEASKHLAAARAGFDAMNALPGGSGKLGYAQTALGTALAQAETDHAVQTAPDGPMKAKAQEHLDAARQHSAKADAESNQGSDTAYEQANLATGHNNVAAAYANMAHGNTTSTSINTPHALATTALKRAKSVGADTAGADHLAAGLAGLTSAPTPPTGTPADTSPLGLANGLHKMLTPGTGPGDHFENDDNVQMLSGAASALAGHHEALANGDAKQAKMRLGDARNYLDHANYDALTHHTPQAVHKELTKQIGNAEIAQKVRAMQAKAAAAPAPTPAAPAPKPAASAPGAPSAVHTGSGDGDGTEGADKLGGGFGATGDGKLYDPGYQGSGRKKEVQAAMEAHKGHFKIIPGEADQKAHAQVTLPDGSRIVVRHSSTSSYKKNASGKIKVGPTISTHQLYAHVFGPDGKLVGSQEMIRDHTTSENDKAGADTKNNGLYRYVRDKLGINPSSLDVYHSYGASDPSEEPATYAMQHAAKANGGDMNATPETNAVHAGLAQVHDAIAKKDLKGAKGHMAALLKDHADTLNTPRFERSLKVASAHLGQPTAAPVPAAAPKLPASTTPTTGDGFAHEAKKRALATDDQMTRNGLNAVSTVNDLLNQKRHMEAGQTMSTLGTYRDLAKQKGQTEQHAFLSAAHAQLTGQLAAQKKAEPSVNLEAASKGAPVATTPGAIVDTPNKKLSPSELDQIGDEHEAYRKDPYNQKHDEDGARVSGHIAHAVQAIKKGDYSKASEHLEHADDISSEMPHTGYDHTIYKLHQHIAGMKGGKGKA